MNELDAIAKEAANLIAMRPFPNKQVVIRAAIDKALEYALTKEPSAEVLTRGRGYGIYPIRAIYRAMTKQLLEELGNSSGTRAGNHPSATDESP